MRGRRGALLLLLPLVVGALSCVASFDVELPDPGEDTPTPFPSPSGIPPAHFTFASWDVEMHDLTDDPAAVYSSDGSLVAHLELVHVREALPLTAANRLFLDEFVTAPDAQNGRIDVLWTVEGTQSPYVPYVGKNLDPRALGEPQPMGVKDLQFRGRDGNSNPGDDAVASVVMPVTGRYALLDLAVHRFRDTTGVCNQQGNDNGVYITVSLDSAAALATLDVPDDYPGWFFAMEPVLDLGLVASNARLHFRVTSNNDECDDTELSWKLVGTSGIAAP